MLKQADVREFGWDGGVVVHAPTNARVWVAKGSGDDITFGARLGTLRDGMYSEESVWEAGMRLLKRRYHL